MSNCIKNTTVENIQKCISVCAQEEACRTLNYHRVEGVCEVLTASKFDLNVVLRYQPGWTHYETDDDAELVG